MEKTDIAIEWESGPVDGQVKVVNGTLKQLSSKQKNRISGCNFVLSEGGRLEIVFSDFSFKKGSFPTIVNIVAKKNSFSFNLRDVNSDTPIYIPEFKVAVVPAKDKRNYSQVAEDIARKELISDFDRFSLTIILYHNLSQVIKTPLISFVL